MPKNIKYINSFILTFALVLFTLSTNAQEVRVIDNKGTRQTINNNRVFRQDTDPNPASPALPITVQGDIWFETNSTSDPNAIGNTLIKIYDGSNWVELVPKAARVFYPPSIAVPASTAGTYSIDLYNDVYKAQFDSPVRRSSGAPDIPTYNADELYYYITEADINVFGDGVTLSTMSISDVGILEYTVVTPPVDDNAILNVVFVVK